LGRSWFRYGEILDRQQRLEGVAMNAAAVLAVFRSGHEPQKMNSKLLGALEELGLDRVPGHPEMLRLFVEPVSTGELDIPRKSFYGHISVMFAVSNDTRPRERSRTLGAWGELLLQENTQLDAPLCEPRIILRQT
jgi:hypothetical protein